MKKLFVVLAVSAFVFSFSSCKKDYTCECEIDMAGNKSTQTFEIPDSKKSDAEDACESNVSSLSTGYASITVECELK